MGGGLWKVPGSERAVVCAVVRGCLSAVQLIESRLPIRLPCRKLIDHMCFPLG